MSKVDVELKHVIKEFPNPRTGEIVRAVDDVSLEIYDGEFFALLGPSGCGKTTTLRMIAGFEDTTSGEILIRGQAVQHVPPFHRPVNTVFQDYALFPHMTVLQNVMFGLKMEGAPRNLAEKRAYEALELVQLPHVADRKPRQLSGGQQQRVALARALVKEPAVLLLDEPLGALDLKLRKAMQYELKAMQQKLGITFIYVTHDQEEAMTMADRIAVMSGGKVLQVGRPEDIYEAPIDRFVADFIGETNFMMGRFVGRNGTFGTVKIEENITIQAIATTETFETSQEVTVAIRPEKIALIPMEIQGSLSEWLGIGSIDEKSTTILPAVVDQVQYIGTDTRYSVLLGDNVLLIARVQNFGHKYDTLYKPGQRVRVFWDNENARILSH